MSEPDRTYSFLPWLRQGLGGHDQRRPTGDAAVDRARRSRRR